MYLLVGSLNSFALFSGYRLITKFGSITACRPFRSIENQSKTIFCAKTGNEQIIIFLCSIKQLPRYIAIIFGFIYLLSDEDQKLIFLLCSLVIFFYYRIFF